jgi:hypothetical protein
MRISASLAAGGAADKAAAIFRKFDANQDNHLNKHEMLMALEEIGVLAGIKARHVGESEPACRALGSVLCGRGVPGWAGQCGSVFGVTF